MEEYHDSTYGGLNRRISAAFFFKKEKGVLVVFVSLIADHGDVTDRRGRLSVSAGTTYYILRPCLVLKIIKIRVT
jgi:hypothetical protein